METAAKNLFIVDDNLLWTASLSKYLKEEFGPKIRVTTFMDGESCIRKLNEHPDLVLMDYQFEESARAKNGIDFLKEIKRKSPETTVFLVTSKKSLKVFTYSLLFGAKEYISKDSDPWIKVFGHIGRSISNWHTRMMEFSVYKYLVIIFTSFIVVGVTVFFANRYFF